MSQIKVSLNLGNLTREVVVESHILSHIFVTHSLSLHEWQKKEKEKIQALFNALQEPEDEEAMLEKVAQYFETVRSIEAQGKSNKELEEAYKEVYLSKQAIDYARQFVKHDGQKVRVKFAFNEIEVHASSSSDPDDIADKYMLQSQIRRLKLGYE